jgi:hypothetical protein
VELDGEQSLEEKYGVEATIDPLLQNLEVLLRLFLLEALRTLQELEDDSAVLEKARRSTGSESPEATAPGGRSLDGSRGAAEPFSRPGHSAPLPV